MNRVGQHETVGWERDRKCDSIHRRVQEHMEKHRTPEAGVEMEDGK